MILHSLWMSVRRLIRPQRIDVLLFPQVKPPVWLGKKKRKPLPPVFIRPRPIVALDAESDAAKATALNKGSAVSNRYNNANGNFADDQTRYDAAIAQWNQRGANMTQAHHDACYAQLASAYAALGGEHNQLATAYVNIIAGGAAIGMGNAATDPNDKTMNYNAASDQYDAADMMCGPAEMNHTMFQTPMAAAEAILVQYG